MLFLTHLTHCFSSFFSFFKRKKNQWIKKSLSAIYLTSHCIRIWHMAILWQGPRTNRNSCVAGAKILDSVGVLLMGRLRHQAINIVMQVGKDLGWTIPWGQVKFDKYNHSAGVRPGGIENFSTPSSTEMSSFVLKQEGKNRSQTILS